MQEGRTPIEMSQTIHDLSGETAMYSLAGFEEVAANGSLKGCLKAINDKQLTGDLLIVCVRRRMKSELQQVLKLT